MLKENELIKARSYSKKSKRKNTSKKLKPKMGMCQNAIAKEKKK